MTTTEFLSKEELINLGWDESNVDMAIEAQEILTNYESVFVTNINSTDEDLNEWIEENGEFALKVEHYELDTFAVWVEGCDYAISLTECELVGTDFEDDELEKALALIECLNLEMKELENIEISAWNESMFEIGNSEYLVVTEEEREQAVTEEIENSLWAFNPSFLAQATDWDLLPVFDSMVKSDMCEDANEPILCLIEKFSSIEDFVESAVSADGYGHFLARYDGYELEEGNYFIYRC